MSRRLVRRRLNQLELRAVQVRQPVLEDNPDLHDYDSMTDEELAAAYAEAVAVDADSPEAQAHAAWLDSLTDDHLVQAIRDSLDKGDREHRLDAGRGKARLSARA
jgi:hypothetical protein